jgi:hypothetical protein
VRYCSNRSLFCDEMHSRSAIAAAIRTSSAIAAPVALPRRNLR